MPSLPLDAIDAELLSTKVAMAPRARLSDAVFEQRKRAFVNEQTTSHWPIRFDADAPRETPIRSASELSPIRRWLVGYRDEDEL